MRAHIQITAISISLLILSYITFLILPPIIHAQSCAGSGWAYVNKDFCTRTQFGAFCTSYKENQYESLCGGASCTRVGQAAGLQTYCEPSTCELYFEDQPSNWFTSAGCYDPADPNPPPGQPPPPPPPPRYDVTGYVFKDLNGDNYKSTADTGVINIPITMAGNYETTNSAGYYIHSDYLQGNYTVSATGSVCGWRYVDNSVPVSLYGGNKTANFPLRHNSSTDLEVQAFRLTDDQGNEKNAFDTGEKAYIYVSSRNLGANQPYSTTDVITGAIHRDKPTDFTDVTGPDTASEPDGFLFQRNLCWNGSTQWSVGSWPSHPRQAAFLTRKEFTVPSAPGSYTARVFLDFQNKALEPSGRNVYDNQMAYPYTVRGYTIQGNVFIDNDDNGFRSPGDTDYTDNIYASSFSDSNGTRPSVSGANFTFSNRRAGGHTIRYTPPTGYKLNSRTPSYTINFADGGYNITSLNPCPPNGPICVNPNSTTVINVNFGIIKAESWIQTQGLNSYFQSGLPMDRIPTSADSSFGSVYMRQSGTNQKSPGILFSGESSIPLASGAVSSPPFNWKAPNMSYPPNTLPLATSYVNLSEKLKNEAVELKDATGGCSDYTNCTLGNGLKPGVYKVGGTLRLNEFSFRKNGANPETDAVKGDYTFIINGSLAIKERIEVRDNRTLLFAVKNDIAIQRNVGRTPGPNIASTLKASDPSVNGIEGIYSAGDDFRLNSYGDCASQTSQNRYDNQLYLDGSIFTNTSGGGGTFDNQRTLCAGNLTYPTLIVRPRLDIMLNAPDYIRDENVTWSEVAP